MSFLDSVTIPNKVGGFAGTQTGGFLDRVSLAPDQRRANQIFSLRQRVEEDRKEAEKLGGLFGIAKGTVIDVAKRTFEEGKGIFVNVFRTFEELPSKIREDIREGAKDIEKGNILIKRKGIFKAGFRVAGDVAIAIFSPVAAVLGAALELTGAQKLIDKAGEVIADKSGITDIVKFQEFAITHPNAGEDFERLLFLAFAKADGSKIDPRRLAVETKNFVNKIVASEVPQPTVKPQVKDGFLEKVERAEVEVRPPTDVAAEVPRVEGKRPSKVAVSVEARAIEKKLTEGFEGLAGFDPITIKEQARLVADLIQNSPERARKMVRGEEPVPENMRGSSLIVGLEELALRKGDAVLLRDIANSPLTAATSRFAQELRILAERAPESVVAIIQSVQKSRAEAFKARNKQTTNQITIQEVKNIKATIRKGGSKRPTWEAFIKEIRCK